MTLIWQEVCISYIKNQTTHFESENREKNDCMKTSMFTVWLGGEGHDQMKLETVLFLLYCYYFYGFATSRPYWQPFSRQTLIYLRMTAFLAFQNRGGDTKSGTTEDVFTLHKIEFYRLWVG